MINNNAAVPRRSKRSIALSHIKTFLVYALTVSAVLLAGVYIDARQNSPRDPSRELPPQKLRALEFGGLAPQLAGKNPLHALPSFIGVTQNGKRVAVTGDGEAAGQAFLALSPILKSLLSANGIVSTDADEGERLLEDFFSASYSVYLKFPGSLLFPAIYALLDGTSWEDADGYAGDLVYISELFVFLDGQRLTAVSRDGDGGFARFHADPVIGEREFSSVIASIAGLSAASPFGFLREVWHDGTTGLTADGFIPVMREFTYINALAENLPLAAFTPSDSLLYRPVGELLRALGFNTDNLQSFADGNSIVAVEEHGTLRVFEGNEIIYRSSGEGRGAHLSRYLGYGRESYSFHEKAQAASTIVNALGAEISGGEASPVLENVVAEDGKTIFVFGYYFNGMRIDGGSGHYISVAVSDNRVTDLHIAAASYTALSKSLGLGLLTFLNGYISGLEDESFVHISDMRMEYTRGEGGFYAAQWRLYGRGGIVQ